MSVLRRYVKKYEGLGSPSVTLKEFSFMVGASYGSVRKSKASYERLGVKFVSKSQANTLKEEGKLTNKTYEKFPYNVRVVKTIINYFNTRSGYPSVYSLEESECSSVMPEMIKPTKALKYLKRVVSPSSVSLDIKKEAYRAEILFNAKHPKQFAEANRESVIKAFDKLFGLTPTEEQIFVVGNMVAYLSNKTFKGVSDAVVQSKAGTSKSVCINVAADILREERGVKTTVITMTGKATGEVKGCKTFAKWLNDKINGNIVGANIEDVVYPYVLDRVTKDPSIKEDALIVDEHSLLGRTEIEIIKLLSNKVIFVGDKAQLSNHRYLPIRQVGVLTEQFRFKKSVTDIQTQVSDARYAGDNKRIDELLEEACSGTFTAELDMRVNDKKGLDVYTYYGESFEPFLVAFEHYKDLDSQVIAYSKNACESINCLMNGGTLEIRVGSKVRLNKTLYKFGQVGLSGNQFIVTTICGHRCSLYSKKHGFLDVNVSDVSLAYALTSITAQGSSWNNVLGIMDTANIENDYNDKYSIVTRAKLSFNCLLKGDVDSEVVNITLPFCMEEGNRNDSVYSGVKVICKRAEKKGLLQPEINSTVNSASGGTAPRIRLPNTPKQMANTPKHKENRYGYVISGKGYPSNEQCFYTKEQATAKLAQLPKGSFITEDLRGTNRIVIDCDSKEAVEAMKRFADTTEAYVSDDSMHLVFTVNGVFKTEHHTKVDLLGNDPTSRSLRNIKENKTYNLGTTAPLTLEVIETLENYLNKDLSKLREAV